MSESEGFLLKLNADQFKLLFPERSNKFMTKGKNGNMVIVDIIPIPKDCILCDYGCNKNMISDDYFYLLMVNNDLVQGTVCSECYERSFKDLQIKEFNEVFKSERE